MVKTPECPRCDDKGDCIHCSSLWEPNRAHTVCGFLWGQHYCTINGVSRCPKISQCKSSAIHHSHLWSIREMTGRNTDTRYREPHIRLDMPHYCTGLSHIAHDQRCCTEHHTHSMPHKGCILR